MEASLAEWDAFFTVTGSSAAALTGLMFVVISLVAGMDQRKRSPDGLSTFSTPTVVHFCGALLVSAVLLAPWHTLLLAAITIGIAAVAGLGYAARIAMRATRLRNYQADWEDVIWYWLLPFVGYGAILGGAIALCSDPHHSLFAVGGGVLILTFLGIHNSWDVVTFLVTIDLRDRE